MKLGGCDCLGSVFWTSALLAPTKLSMGNWPIIHNNVYSNSRCDHYNTQSLTKSISKYIRWTLTQPTNNWETLGQGFNTRNAKPVWRTVWIPENNSQSLSTLMTLFALFSVLHMECQIRCPKYGTWFCEAYQKKERRISMKFLCLSLAWLFLHSTLEEHEAGLIKVLNQLKDWPNTASGKVNILPNICSWLGTCGFPQWFWR